MSGTPLGPVERLEMAIAIGSDGRITHPLDLIDLIKPAAADNSLRRQTLWRRLFLEAPLPYWLLVTWARKLKAKDLATLFAETTSTDWQCVPSTGSLGEPVIHGPLFQELADRFDAFDPNLFPWDGGDDGDPIHRKKFVLGRELARSYLQEFAGDNQGIATRTQLLFDQQPAWEEWIGVNRAIGFSPMAICEATAVALDHIVSRDITPGINGVGRTRILLEQLNVSNNPVVGIVTASIWPVNERLGHLDGALVPDLRENGLLVISPEFLEGVRDAWRYVRSVSPEIGPAMLCFSVRPSAASVVQQLSGRSAELSILAAIESAVNQRVLRSDAAASATLRLFGPDGAESDPATGPASFEDKKYVAAIRHRLSTIVVHSDVARQWKLANPSASEGKKRDEPDVVASEFYRRDVRKILETQSQWKLAYLVPGGISLVFTAMASLFWQLYKASASPMGAELLDIDTRMPLVTPALIGSEIMSLALCLLMILHCHRSIQRSLDSHRSSLLAFSVCSVVVLLAQFLPIGVRYEGLLDTPLYSVLFGEPQVTPQLVLDQGGGGFLILHAISQSIAFIAILYGVSAFAIRLIQTRAHSEPIYEDRCELIKKDWRFSLALISYFCGVVIVLCLLRNALWYYYLVTLPGIELIDNEGSVLAVIAPLMGISMVLVMSVGTVWLYLLNRYLTRVVRSAQGRSGYTVDDVVATLPKMARWLYLIKPSEY